MKKICIIVFVVVLLILLLWPKGKVTGSSKNVVEYSYNGQIHVRYIDNNDYVIGDTYWIK